MKTLVVVPWHNVAQRNAFMVAWGIDENDSRVVFQQDTSRQGCAKTKNRGIERVMHLKADVIIILDDDCYPHEGQSLSQFMSAHEEALQPQEVELFQAVTSPPSRGTPYFERSVVMPVAASMGFWSEIGDYDAPGQLVHGSRNPMEFKQDTVYGRYFPLCGMNLAFKVDQWPWCRFIDVPRFDDIWQGFLWQKRAYSEGKCFNLRGPLVRHSRQSNVWQNLKDEAQNLERNETIWKQIHAMPMDDYNLMLCKLGLTY